MKKVIFALAAVVALAACSQEDVIIADKGAAIGFDTFVENSTRSVNDPSFVMGGNMFTQFGVFGTVENASLFAGNMVENKNGKWEYEGTQYWIAGAKYNFAAVAPYGAYTNAAYTSVDYVGTTTLSFENTNGTTDLLYAWAETPGKVSGNEVVQLNFRHTLSKVKFSFENAYNASTATIKVHSVQIENAHKNANATFVKDATTWTNQTNAVALTFGNASDDESTTVKEGAEVAFGFGKTYESLNERLLIPGAATPLTGDTKAGYKVTFKVDLLVNGTPVKTYNHTAYANFTPVAGHAYDIKTTITPANIDPAHAQEAIQFTVTTIGNWGTDDNGEEDGDNNKTM